MKNNGQARIGRCEVSAVIGSQVKLMTIIINANS